uniref:Uncharacterized protein n=1 Tax=Magnetospirillum gryphiswaldense TaxID=55518 RepID=A4U325_9PROT|nr:hypothetical protein MGR_2468 [Magnetospirillum gryphiswaldense MSR-1]
MVPRISARHQCACPKRSYTRPLFPMVFECPFIASAILPDDCFLQYRDRPRQRGFCRIYARQTSDGDERKSRSHRSMLLRPPELSIQFVWARGIDQSLNTAKWFKYLCLNSCNGFIKVFDSH